MSNLKKSLRDCLLEASEEVYDLRDLQEIGEEAENLSLGSIDLKECSFSGCSFLDSRFQATGFDRVVFRDCDLTGCSFSECGLRQVTFLGCRMLGTNFSDCTLTGCRFEDCQGKYMGLVACTLKQPVLSDCSMSGGSLSRSKLQRPSISRCDLTRCDFSGAELGSVDLSTSAIDGATWTISQLKNITVTTAQAIDLARLMGLNIVP